MADIVTLAVELVQRGARKPTVAKLAALVGADEGAVLAALTAAPDHVKRAFGITPAVPRPVLKLAAFRLPR